MQKLVLKFANAGIAGEVAALAASGEDFAETMKADTALWKEVAAADPYFSKIEYWQRWNYLRNNWQLISQAQMREHIKDLVTMYQLVPFQAIDELTDFGGQPGFKDVGFILDTIASLPDAVGSKTKHILRLLQNHSLSEADLERLVMLVEGSNPEADEQLFLHILLLKHPQASEEQKNGCAIDPP